MNELYFDSSYLRNWNARIVQVTSENESSDVILDQTAFYPEGGGQPADHGTVNGIPVQDLLRNEEGQVVHRLAESLHIEAGEEVYCEIDWKRRFDHMQQHSGQHLLSAICLETLRAPTVSFHLGEQEATIDIAIAELTIGQLGQIEQQVNEYIYRNLPVRSYFVNQEQLSALHLVKRPKVTENVRIVEIEGVEHNACGGTHVSHTGELGIIKLLRSEKNKGNTRLYFKCGQRALEDYNEALHVLGAVAGRFNTGRKDIISRLDKWEQEQQLQREELERLRHENDQFIVQQLLGSVINETEQEQQITVVTHWFTDRSLSDLQRIANLILEQNNITVLLASALDCKVVLAQQGHPNLKCGAFFKENLSGYGGKGGGNDHIAQAGFGNEQQLRPFYEDICMQIKGNIKNIQ